MHKYSEQSVKLDIAIEEVFFRLYPHFETLFLLESLGRQGSKNRYSYVGFDPEKILSADHCNFDELKTYGTKKPQGSGYRGGLVGYMSYEGTKYFEPAFVGHQTRDFPDFEFGLYQDGFKYDKKTKELVYFYNKKSRLSQILPLIQKKEEIGKFGYTKKSVSKSDLEYRHMLDLAGEQLMAGNIFQVVLSVKTEYQVSGDIRQIYKTLREVNPSPYMSFLKFGSRQIVCASPELLIQTKGRQIEHFGTLAGTIGRGKDKQEDEKLASQLLADEKERAEHLMLVDLARNDLGRICEFGSIKVAKLLSVRRYSHVQHIYSEVRGRLRKGEDALSALAACFPAGTLSGAPKIEAMKIISKLEQKSRGPYGGVVGYISYSGDAMFAITIRSLFVNGSKAYTQTGSGIVLDSQPANEAIEIKKKQAAMERTLEKAQGGHV